MGKEEEDKWRQKMMEKFAEDDKIEQMNAHRRRMRKEEHKRAVDALLNERREQRKREKMEDHVVKAELEAEEQRQKEILNEERRRILTKHFEHLKGFIPKGVLSQEDFEGLER